jgi:starch synthase (maltosyl-transferring)
MDVWPTVESGRRPTKGAVDEEIPVEATVIREGHDALAVDLVAIRPDGTRCDPVRMVDLGQSSDRWRATIRPDSEGDWGFLSSLVGPVRHLDASGIKVPAGRRELELEEGARVLDRAAVGVPGQWSPDAAAAALRNVDLPEESRWQPAPVWGPW